MGPLENIERFLVRVDQLRRKIYAACVRPLNGFCLMPIMMPSMSCFVSRLFDPT